MNLVSNTIHFLLQPLKWTRESHNRLITSHVRTKYEACCNRKRHEKLKENCKLQHQTWGVPFDTILKSFEHLWRTAASEFSISNTIGNTCKICEQQKKKTKKKTNSPFRQRELELGPFERARQELPEPNFAQNRDDVSANSSIEQPNFAATWFKTLLKTGKCLTSIIDFVWAWSILITSHTTFNAEETVWICESACHESKSRTRASMLLSGFKNIEKQSTQTTKTKPGTTGKTSAIAAKVLRRTPSSLEKVKFAMWGNAGETSEKSGFKNCHKKEKKQNNKKTWNPGGCVYPTMHANTNDTFLSIETGCVGWANRNRGARPLFCNR